MFKEDNRLSPSAFRQALVTKMGGTEVPLAPEEAAQFIEFKREDGVVRVQWKRWWAMYQHGESLAACLAHLHKVLMPPVRTISLANPALVPHLVRHQAEAPLIARPLFSSEVPEDSDIELALTVETDSAFQLLATPTSLEGPVEEAWKAAYAHSTLRAVPATFTPRPGMYVWHGNGAADQAWEFARHLDTAFLVTPYTEEAAVWVSMTEGVDGFFPYLVAMFRAISDHESAADREGILAALSVATAAMERNLENVAGLILHTLWEISTSQYHGLTLKAWAMQEGRAYVVDPQE